MTARAEAPRLFEEGGRAMYPRFGLVLCVTHGCNMRCRYCYAGTKRAEVMPEGFGRKAIDRAVASIEPGGTLDLGFFGGAARSRPHREAHRLRRPEDQGGRPEARPDDDHQRHGQ